MPIPEGLADAQLLFDHSLCHALFNRKREFPDSIADWTFEDLVDYHWLLQGEMERRGFVHKDFDDLDGLAVGKSTVQSLKNVARQINAKSIYLPAPHARWTWTGEKKLIIKSRSYGGMLNKPLYWGDSNYIYGVLKLTNITPITDKEFEDLRPQHLVSDKERQKWWPNSHRLYAYDFEILTRFKKPRPHHYQRGTQVFFPSPEWKSDETRLTIAVDLDGTIADTDWSKPIPESFLEAKPLPLAKESMDELADMATIIIYTGRDPRYFELTANWLKRYEIPYDELILGKPEADMYIDDLAVSFENNWRDVVGVATAAGELFHEEKIEPLGRTAIDVGMPTTHQEAVRTVRSEESVGKHEIEDEIEFNFEYEIENGIVIAKAAMPKANKPARRFYDVEKLPEQFKFPEILVEMKFDGMDMMLSKEKVWSGRGLDKTQRVPHITAELEKWPHKSFVLHGQAQMFTDDEPMHRTVAIGYINGNAPVEEGKNLRITVFDIIELDGKDLTDTPMIERLKLLRKEFKGSPHVPVITEKQFALVSRNKLVETAKRMADIKGSEGAMLFDPHSRWQKGKTINFGWAKWKKLKEIDILVIKKERKEAGWRYLGAIGPLNEAQVKTLPSEKVAEMKGKKWLLLGHTHVSSVDVNERDILRVQALEIVRNNKYDYSYQNAVPMYPPEKNVPDGLDVAEDLAALALRKAVERTKVDDVAGYLYQVDREGKPLPTPEEITRDITVRKQFATDPDSGSQEFEPGRTTEGVRTTGPPLMPMSTQTAEGATNLEKIVDIETYDPRKIKDYRVLLDDHRITHAWWSTLQAGKPLKHDKATVRALHDEIAREIERRGMKHDSPLGATQKGGFLSWTALTNLLMKKDNLHIEFIGTSAETEPKPKGPDGKERLFTSTLIGNILINLTSDHQKWFEQNQKRIKGILLSHAANDTIGDWVKKTKITIPLYTTKSLIADAKRRFNADLPQSFENIELIDPGKSFKIDNVKVEAVEVAHALGPTYAFKFNDIILHSEDILDFRDPKVLKDVRLWIADGSLIDRDIERIMDGKRIGHMAMQRAIAIAEEQGVENVVFTQVGKNKGLSHDELHDEVHKFADKEHPKLRHLSIAWEGKTLNVNKMDPPEKWIPELQKADGGFTYAPGGIIGVPGMGGGQRVPAAPDNTFREVSPFQYTQVEEKRLIMHVFFSEPEAKIKAEAWRKRILDLARAQGLKVNVTLDPLDGGIIGSLSVDTDRPLQLSEEIKKQVATCAICGKEITDPTSVARGVGPECWAQLPPAERERFLPRAQKQMPPEESTTRQPVTWSPSPTTAISPLIELGRWEIQFLGTSGEKTFPRTDCQDEQCKTDKRLNASAVYRNAGTNILLDMGHEDLAQRIQEKLNAVCLTHAHHDHVDGLAKLPKDVPLLMHRKTWGNLMEYQPDLAKELSEREVHLYNCYNVIKVGDAKVRWLPVTHSNKFHTYALRLDRNILYSPDLGEIEDQWLKGISVWIIDGESLKRDVVKEKGEEEARHQSIMHSLKQAKQAEIPQVIVTHIGHIGIKSDDLPSTLTALAKEVGYEGHIIAAMDGFTIPLGGIKKSEEIEQEERPLPEPKDGQPYPAEFYKGPKWLHGKSFAYIIHHHFPFGPIVNKDGTYKSGTAADVKITGPGPGEAGGTPPKGADTAPRDPDKAETYVAKEYGLEVSKSAGVEVEKGVGGFREHWETRQDTGDPDDLIGWTFLPYPWEKLAKFFSGPAKGMCTAKPAIPKETSKKYPRGWLDVQGIRKPVILGGAGASAERNRSGFFEILEEGTFEYGTQRNNLHEYFFHGKLLNGRYIFRLLKLASGSPRWLAFRPPDQKPMDPKKHEDSGFWRLVGETEAPVQSPGEERKPLESD